MDHRTGSCLCGAVRFTAAIKAPKVVACHCAMCRKWGGGPSLSVECDKNIHIDIPEKVIWFESSQWAERGFCKRCGSSLFYRFNDKTGDYANVSAAALDKQDDLELSLHVFIDSKPCYYDFSDNAPRMTGAEVIAQFAKE